MPLNYGDVFAGYTIQRLLGAGGMGEVYLAQHPRLPRLDALKILSLDATDDEEFRARFNREAELAATLWHPHIVGVHDRGEFNGRLWISMDYVKGTDARQLVEYRYPSGMPQADVVEIVTAVAEALDFAHDRRLLHRDVKPANILVTIPSESARRRVLLTDFGIARETDDTSGLTEARMAIGTVAYAAPEQLTSKSLDGRVDEYALAATAFHLLTGAPPFEDSNRAVVIGHHLNSPPPRLSDRQPQLAHLDAVMAKALAKDPDDRYPRCLDFARAFSERADHAAHPERIADRPPDVQTETSGGPSALLPLSGAEAQLPGPDSGVHTAPFDAAEDRAASEPSHTKRLDQMTVHGTAVSVQKRPAGRGSNEEVWSFRVERYESSGRPHTVVPVELRGTSITGQLSDGDMVEVSGIWDNSTLFADTVINHSAASRGRRRPSSPAVKKRTRTPAVKKRTRTPAVKKRTRTPTVAAVRSSKATKARTVTLIVGIVAVAAIAVLTMLLTRALGLWSDDGPIVQPQRATVISPGGALDHPGQAGLAIDGDPDTAWPTDTYLDAEPFPVFKQGVGLMLQLSEPTALSSVTVDVPSTGTEVQIRAADSASPASLSDTTELTPSVVLQPGHNRIPVDSTTRTSNVLVWITKLGTTDGESRTAISDITLRGR